MSMITKVSLSCPPLIPRLVAVGVAAGLATALTLGAVPARASATAIAATVAPTVAPSETAAAGALSPRRALVRAVRQQIVDVAISKQGSGYVWGGSGPDSFDCSGFVMWVYQQAMGTTLPHYSGAQMDVATPVTGKLRRGDLLFYGPHGSQHVSIYIGRGLQVGANNPRTGVVIDSVAGTYWSERYVGAGRIRPAR